MFGFDPQHTHFNPSEHILSPATVSKLTLGWTASVGAGGQDICSTPAVADGLLYIDDGDGSLDAFDTRTGVLVWQYNLKDPCTHGCSSPTVVNGIVYIGTGASFTAQLLALNAHTGVLLWSYYKEGLTLSTPTVTNGILYTEEGAGTLYAFNAITGALLWKAAGGAAGDIQIASAPAVANGVVYAPVTNTFDFHIYLEAFNAQTGVPLWKSSALAVLSDQQPTYFDAAPAVVNGLVYIGAAPTSTVAGGTGGNLDAFNAQTGAVVWSESLHLGQLQSVPVASVAVANGLLFVGSRNGVLYALNAQTGQQLWRAAFPGLPVLAIDVLTPIVANGVLYVSTSGYSAPSALFALDAQTGRLLWSSTQGARYGISSVVVVNGMLYACSWSGNHLYAFHLPGKDAGS